MKSIALGESLYSIAFMIPPHIYESIDKALQPQPVYMQVIMQIFLPIASVIAAGIITYFTARMIMDKKAAIDYKLHMANVTSTLIRETFELMDQLIEYYIETRQYRERYLNTGIKKAKYEKLEELNVRLVQKLSKVYSRILEVKMTTHENWNVFHRLLNHLEKIVLEQKTYLHDEDDVAEIQKVIEEFHEDTSGKLISLTNDIQVYIRKRISAGYTDSSFTKKPTSKGRG